MIDEFMFFTFFKKNSLNIPILKSKNMLSFDNFAYKIIEFPKMSFAILYL